MSSILKALKKLEEERARREPGSVNIACDILRSRPRRRGRPDGWRGGGTVALGLGLAGAALVWWLAQVPGSAPDPAGRPGQPTAGPVAAAGPAEVRPAGKATEPGQDTPERLVRAPGTPEPGGDPLTGNPPVPSPAPGPAAVATGVRDRRADEPGTVEPEAAPEDRTAPATEATGATAEAAPDLILNGIAWQDQRGRRMAIINDLPVLEGTVVEGAHVLEILPDRVRLERGGATVVLTLE